MAELVDALASGASDLTVVEVRVLFWHHFCPMQKWFLIGVQAPSAVAARSLRSRLVAIS
jgi:hypothetical protein